MPLQAVVVADSYNRRFDPLSHSTPRTLLHVCNEPLLTYVLGFLNNNNVNETFVVARTNADRIRAYLKEVAPKYEKMKIKCIVSQGSYNFGDALRDLETRKLITDDFVLVTGDIISNYQLSSVIEEHKARASADKDCLMTMVLTQCDHEHPVRSIEEDSFAVINPSDKRLLYLENLKDDVKIPLDRVMEHGRVELRYDLVDSHIYICTPLMLMQFADNFDYGNVYDLIHGVIEHEEIVDYKIHTAVSPEFYATRCANLTSYDAISQDVLNRWAYPLVPDLFPFAGAYECGRSNIYLQSSSTLERSCRLLGSVIVGPDSTVGTHDGPETTARNSVIGPGCKIGAGCHLNHAYILKGVTIGDSCTIDYALIGENVIIHDGVVIPHGCVIGPGVELGPNIVLEKHTRVSLEKQELEEDDMIGFIAYDEEQIARRRNLSTLTEESEESTESEEMEDGRPGMPASASDASSDEEHSEEEEGAGQNERGYDVAVVGEQGRGFAFVPELLPEEGQEHTCWKETEEQEELYGGVARMMSRASEIEDEWEDEDTDSLASEEVEEDQALFDADAEFEDFYHEVLDVIKARVDRDNVPNTNIDVIKLEITGSRAAHSMAQPDVCCAIIRAIIDSASDITNKSKCGRYLISLTATMAPILENYIQTDTDQVVFIQNVKEFCLENEHAKPFFMKLLHTLYEHDVLEEDMLLQWYEGNNPGEDTTSEFAKLYQQVEPFMRWLQEAEVESSEED